MSHLAKKIDQFTDELFVDLGLTALPEEQKADIFARVEEHFHRAILDTFRSMALGPEIAAVELALREESYRDLEKLLKKYPRFAQPLEEKINNEFDQLKLTIAEEQEDARKNSATAGNGTQAGAAPGA